jgi:hypothetical protein
VSVGFLQLIHCPNLTDLLQLLDKSFTQHERMISFFLFLVPFSENERRRGNASEKRDGSLTIVSMEKKLQASIMHYQRFGE